MATVTASSGTAGAMRQPLCALVTRPRAGAESLARALAERGVAAILAPLLEIRYRDGPLPDLAAVQAILCTSANGVRALARLSGERALPLFAVGDATAAQAQAAGFARVESAGGNVADLARLARARLCPAAGRLLHVAGSEVAGDLAGELRAAGFMVERSVLYEARPASSLDGEAAGGLAEGRVDAALFFSPRSAAIFARLAAAAGLAEAMRRVTALSLSQAADRALGGLPFRARLIAARPDQPALLSALDRLIAQADAAERGGR
jgi:uroporphyrinogen-III synthase